MYRFSQRVGIQRKPVWAIYVAAGFNKDEIFVAILCNI
jgi:hypothetical protein